MTLIERLEKEGVVIGGKNPERGSQEWILNGTTLGWFDAHEGWAVLRRRDMGETWHIAIWNGMGEFYGR